MNKENTVFISYSSKDLGVVNRIAEEFDRMGVLFWKAPEMIPAGSSYAKEIPKAIQECDVFLLLLSKSSQDSIWVEKEIDSAICHRKTILPVQIEELELNDTFQFYLSNIQIITFYKNEEEALRGMKRKLKPEEAKEDTKTIEENTSVPQEQVVEEQVVEVQVVEEKVVERKMSFEMEEPKKRMRGNANSLRMNRIPLACQHCGCKDLEYISMGTYRCVRCSKDNYDDFQTIRNYLDKAGAMSAIVIERETGVPRRIIEYFFEEEYLEIPKGSPDRVPCRNCGAPIRTGILCERCKTDGNRVDRSSRKDLWHSYRKRKIGD